MLKNRIAQNASWIILCKIGQALLSLIVTMISARYLGPAHYGVINYAAAIVTFVTPIAQLGLSSIQVQEYTKHPNGEGEILGSSLAMVLISSVICIIGVISFAVATNLNQKETIAVCALYSTILLFQGAEIIQYWFQYKYLSKYYSIFFSNT